MTALFLVSGFAMWLGGFPDVAVFVLSMGIIVQWAQQKSEETTE